MMKYTIEFDNYLDACAIKVSGDHKRPNDSYVLLRIAGEFAKEHGCSRFLFDMREANIIGSTMGAFDTAVDPENHGFSRLYRIASVYQTLTEDHKFMENVAANRGTPAFRVFDDIDKAYGWLKS